jgi:hypothetical protein
MWFIKDGVVFPWDVNHLDPTSCPLAPTHLSITDPIGQLLGDSERRDRALASGRSIPSAGEVNAGERLTRVLNPRIRWRGRAARRQPNQA